LFVTRAAWVTSALLILLSPALPALAQAPAPPLPARSVPVLPAARFTPPEARRGQAITAVRVVGNQRIEAGTIQSYMLLRVGDPYDPAAEDRSLKALYATGLFTDVSIRREGTALVVTVSENPLVNRVAFEGNHKLTDTILRPEMQMKPRSVYTAGLAEADRQRILDLYARRGRFGTTVNPKIIKLEQNRVDVIYEIDDGLPTLISRIAFVGNKAFSESKLREIVGSREESWWRILSTSDTYDPDRVNFDKELLRRYYLHKGYADFEVTTANAELAPDKSAFFLTFAVNEGERYALSKVDVTSTLPGLSADSIRDVVDVSVGDWYDGEAIERLTQELTQEAQNRGFAFAEVRPQVKRDREKHEIALTFDITQGPRVYVERIEINGNVRTMDKVIRREFRLAEGDAFNAALMRRSRQRLQDLDYFNTVTITPSPGSTPDKAIVTTVVDEKSTGELTFGGGYSTDIGPLLTGGIHEKNLIGTGIDAGLSGLIAQKQTQINLSVTDPYFLGRNLVAGFDLFRIVDNLQQVAQYNESRTGTTLRVGYEFTEHLRQLWSYSLVDRNVYSVQPAASIYVQNAKGDSLLSQISQTLTLDYRDSRLDPHSGYVVRLGTDFAGLGGTARFVRTKVDTAYYIPLEATFGDPAWGIAILAGAGYLFNTGKEEKIIDRFFLGGDNLRGFATGGAGPHATATGDSLGGRFIWTQTTELRFPLPISADIGLTGRAFVDIGSLSQINQLVLNGTKIGIIDDAGPRIAAGVGFSWKTPFGLLNIDFAQPIVKKRHDQTQFFRFGFGTRF
jgi:outer membrane protein insertion porin family